MLMQDESLKDIGLPRIDKAIKDTDEVICNNIQQLADTDRGLLSQNILGHLRNFVEYIAIKVYSKGKDVNPNDYNLNINAMKELQRRGDLRFLYKFHEMLQKSVSHYTMDKDGSERLMLKYLEHLLKIKKYLFQTYGMQVLQNINKFPLYSDDELSDYYKKIAERIETASASSYPVRYDDRYYIQKIKPFISNEELYYEVTFTTANNNVSKFDRIIAFTKDEIPDYYAVKFSIRNDFIQVLGKKMTVLIIEKYEISIRPCEWNNFAEIVGIKIRCNTGHAEYRAMMDFLSKRKMTLTELVCCEDDYYTRTRERITATSRKIRLYGVLDKCRTIILGNKQGANVLRYLLHKMNNRIIKSQRSNEKCQRLSGLFLDYGCIPFDEMPFCSSLRHHNPRVYDLFECLSTEQREHEFLARFLKNNTEIESELFTPISEINRLENLEELVDEYNSRVYYKHVHRQIKEYKGHLYISGYVSDCTQIIRKLQELSLSGIEQYSASVDSWLRNESYVIDDTGKREALRTMFAQSRVAIVYGSAGTGKSTLIKHISNFWADKEKLFLANTHPAVDNMRRKVKAPNCEYTTIAKFLSSKACRRNCDLLVIDECSTVSNEDMRKVLETADFQILVLVGDVYQIESINFGNWFGIARKFLPDSSIFELTHPYRTKNDELLTVWDRVRKLDDSILEPLIKGGYVSKFDKTIFERTAEDEVILCLNYDGLYGINNINRFLQNANPNEPIMWGLNYYKIGDPILFNESNIFSPLIYNNSKGKIVGISMEERKIWFDIELEESINELDAVGYEFELTGKSDNGNSIITFGIDKHKSSDEDDDERDMTVVPFQISYAISIHKAQGLEYDSVKIIITNEVEERITHNIFYTAITRAKEKLKIYWSPETEQAILDRLEIKDNRKDTYLLSQLSSLEMR